MPQKTAPEKSPFGMMMEGNNTLWGSLNGHHSAISLTGYLYLYNGKEWNRDNGLNWYDYGKRWYDPALGRFPSVDPIIDEFPYLTPYNYASNDPIKNIDLWGLQGVSAVIRQKVETLSAWLASDKPTSQKIQDVRETLIPNITTVMDAAGQGRVPTPNELGAATFEFAATFLLPFSEGKAFNVSSKAASSTELNAANYVYRSLTSANAETLAAGKGIFAKAPEGAWTLEQHLIHGSSPKSFLNNPWIATSSDINIARAFSSGNGLVRIDLSKISVNSIQRGWMTLPRSSAGYHYSIWQQEVSIFGHIPQKAIQTIK